MGRVDVAIRPMKQKLNWGFPPCNHNELFKETSKNGMGEQVKKT